jgi:ferrous iron transport protein A
MGGGNGYGGRRRGRRGRCGHCLRAGSCLVVKGIDPGHPSARRLMDMGFGRGCRVRVERVSPFGDPCIVNLRGYSLAVRARDLDAIEAEEARDPKA